jgi:hypothetical protein
MTFVAVFAVGVGVEVMEEEEAEEERRESQYEWRRSAKGFEEVPSRRVVVKGGEGKR